MGRYYESFSSLMLVLAATAMVSGEEPSSVSVLPRESAVYLPREADVGEEVADFNPHWVTTGRPSFRHAKTLFRWPGQEPNFEIGGPPRMVTDRPHFSEASSLVGLGRVQFETGNTFTQDRNAGTTTRSQSFGEPLMRAGIFAEWFEFRLADTLLRETTQDGTGSQCLRGLDDMYLGAKLALTEQDGMLPEMAIFPQMRLPTGRPGITSGKVLPGYNFAYSWMLNGWIELECNSQMNRRVDDTDHSYVEVIQTVNIEYEFTEQFMGFTEWMMFTPCGAVSAQTQHYFHGGFWCLLTPNLQVDVHAGVGLSRASDDLAFTGGGLSWRF